MEDQAPSSNMHNSAHSNSLQYGGYHGSHTTAHAQRTRKTSDPEPEPEIDFFQDMAPQYKKAAKVWKYMHIDYYVFNEDSCFKICKIEML